MKTFACIAAALAAVLLAACATQEVAATRGTKSPPFQAGFASVNGIRMYYEVHGSGEGTPLVLLHGGGSTIESTWGRILPLFAQHRKVIAIEEQAHGRTSDRDQPVRFETSADDVAALLAQLKVPSADVMGFSNGAGVALQVAIRHPQQVRKLVFASFFTKKEGGAPQLWSMLDHATFADMPLPLKDAFLKVNPDPQKLRIMHDKDLERMQHFQDVSDEVVRSVRVPTLIVLGDHDIVVPAYALELSRTIPNARLLIVPGTHGDYLGEVSAGVSKSRTPEWNAGLIEDFLDQP